VVALRFDRFKGELPRLDPHLLPEGYAQTSTNDKSVQGGGLGSG
jgi:hypothetical protein